MYLHSWSTNIVFRTVLWLCYNHIETLGKFWKRREIREVRREVAEMGKEGWKHRHRMRRKQSNWSLLSVRKLKQRWLWLREKMIDRTVKMGRWQGMWFGYLLSFHTPLYLICPSLPSCLSWETVLWCPNGHCPKGALTWSRKAGRENHWETYSLPSPCLSMVWKFLCFSLMALASARLHN